MHTGHQHLFNVLNNEASLRHLEPLIVTFDRHPREVLQPGYQPELLSSFHERLDRLKCFGCRCVVLDFAAIQSYTARQFMQMLYDQYEVRALLMGYDHRFGSDGLTNIEDFRRIGTELNMGVVQAEQLVMEDGEHVSSTDIRRLLRAGDMERANYLLRHFYTLEGTVVHGKGVGSQIGFPTANIALDEPRKLLPLQGVYIALAIVGDFIYPALVNIGTNPTVGVNPMSIEVHIPAFDGDLYGQHIEVQLLNFVRPERKFDSLEALREQIAQDLKALEEDPMAAGYRA